MFEVTAQILGWIAVPIGILRYQIADAKRFLLANTLTGYFLAAHYWLIGGFSGAIISFVSGSSSLLQATLGSKLSLAFRLLVAVIAIACAISFKEDGSAAYLPLTAFVMARIFEAIRHDIALRVALLFATSLWILYGYILESPQIMILEIFGLISNLIYLLKRRSIYPKQHKKQ